MKLSYLKGIVWEII